VDFRRTLEAVTTALVAEGVRFALIGGVALAALGVGRATGDVDLLADGDRADDVDRILRGLGYAALHRSPDAANYVGSDPSLCRVDLLYARRAPSRAMLARAAPYTIHGVVAVPVVQAEDVIGLKVQASSNDARRLMLDVGDIERLLIARPTVDLARVREYFVLFDREAELDALLARIGRA
jgi:predicted nucleotidyltransferase